MRKPFLYALCGTIGLLCLYVAYVAISEYRGQPLESRSDQPDVAEIGVQYASQTDQRWAGKKIGNTSQTFAEVGCTLCSISMALSAVQVAITPLELNEQLLKNGGYTASGLVIWKKVKLDGHDVSIQVGSTTHRAIYASLKNGKPVIAKILLADYANHWVVIVGINQGRYLVKDPLNAGNKPVYLDLLSRSIYGIRIIGD